MFGINKGKIKEAFFAYEFELKLIDDDHNIPLEDKLSKRVTLVEDFITNLKRAFE